MQEEVVPLQIYFLCKASVTETTLEWTSQSWIKFMNFSMQAQIPLTPQLFSTILTYEYFLFQANGSWHDKCSVHQVFAGIEFFRIGFFHYMISQHSHSTWHVRCTLLWGDRMRSRRKWWRRGMVMIQLWDRDVFQIVDQPRRQRGFLEERLNSGTNGLRIFVLKNQGCLFLFNLLIFFCYITESDD